MMPGLNHGTVRAGIAMFLAAITMTTTAEVNAVTNDIPSERETAVLGGGCFWCLEAVYEEMEGVHDVVSGYAGGDDPSPAYKEVCDGTTGHAEVVRIDFDPRSVTFDQLLEVFFAIHDPTSLNRQGADVGTQYRSIILYADDAQKAAAEAAIAQENEHGGWGRPLVTEVEPLATFHAAEDYHQDYFRRNPEQGYCQAVVAPKVQKARKAFPERLKR